VEVADRPIHQYVQVIGGTDFGKDGDLGAHATGDTVVHPEVGFLAALRTR